MNERYEDGGRQLDEAYRPVVFEKGYDDIDTAIAQRTELFFDHIKKTMGLNYLAQEAAKEAEAWSEEIDVVPLAGFGEKPMRVVHELRYYGDTTVAAVIRDYQSNGSIAVSFSRHIPAEEEHDAVYGAIEALDQIITRETF